MKQFICFFLVVCLGISLSACSEKPGNIQTPASFYYCNSSVYYDSPEGVISAEIRDIAAYENDIQAILDTYLQGPASELLYSPFPNRTSVVRLSQTGQELSVVMSESFAALTGMDLSLACACLAKTLFSLSDVQSITIQARSSNLDTNRSVTLTRDSLLLLDEIVVDSTEK